jgi:hypothetical protein
LSLLSGGASHNDAFDPKPETPDFIRRAFRPIATRTPEIEVSELLPPLAQSNHLCAIYRSLSAGTGNLDAGHQIMLPGRS